MRLRYCEPPWSTLVVSMFFRTIAHAKGVLETGLTALAALEEPVVEELTLREEPAKNGEMMLVGSTVAEL